MSTVPTGSPAQDTTRLLGTSTFSSRTCSANGRARPTLRARFWLDDEANARHAQSITELVILTGSSWEIRIEATYPGEVLPSKGDVRREEVPEAKRLVRRRSCLQAAFPPAP